MRCAICDVVLDIVFLDECYKVEDCPDCQSKLFELFLEELDTLKPEEPEEVLNNDAMDKIELTL